MIGALGNYFFDKIKIKCSLNIYFKITKMKLKP